MNLCDCLPRLQSRRDFLCKTAGGMGALALGWMLDPLARAQSPSLAGALGVVNPLHFAPKAKRVIYLYQAGGPSHLETFDFKPELARLNGQRMPESFTKGQPIAQLQNAELRVLGPQFEFAKCGASGQEISATLPNIQKIADDICIIRSMKTDQINHDPAHTFMNTGTSISGRPSMGSWLVYGLGSEAENLPGFVVLISVGAPTEQPVSTRQWHSGFLPSEFQGVQFNSKGEPVYYVNKPHGVSSGRQGDVVNAVEKLNRLHGEAAHDPELETRIRQYEMAFKMQTSVPELADISSEPASVLEAYGVKELDGSYAANCLLARRMAERGVRFIQLYHRSWDHHVAIRAAIPLACRMVDQATAALITDLKQRGMLDETLVIWGGEFGRTPMAQGDGRDHHIKGFSMWMAGGGIKGGMTYGATDEMGYAAVENVVEVHDLHATMLSLLGIDHKRFTYRYQGRDFRLTDVSGEVVRPILA